MLLGERGPCPVCDQFDCTHQFYGDNHYRFGDPMAKNPRMKGRTIPAPHRIVDEANERVVFGAGDLMTPAEAEKWGVTVPASPAPGRRKGETQAAYDQRMKRLREDRARKPREDRSA